MKKDNDKYCTFYIVRHGETVWNVQGLTQGHGDSPLTENGIKQAKELASFFKGVVIDEIFTSDLPRAKKTAEFIASKHKITIKEDRLLRERCYGKFEGKAMSEYSEQLKYLLNEREKLDADGQFKFKLAADIESDEEIIIRFVTFMKKIAREYKGKRVLIVSHGGMMRILLVYLGFGTRKEIASNAVNNLGYIKVDCDGNKFFIRETQNIEKRFIK